MEHSSLERSQVVNLNFTGPSVVVWKLTISDASSERCSDSQLSSAKGSQFDWLGMGRWTHDIAFTFSMTVCRSIPPHVCASDETAWPAPGVENEDLSSSHSMTPSAGLWQTFLRRAPSRTLKALSSSYVNHGPGAPMRQLCACLQRLKTRLTNEEKCQGQDYKHIGLF